MAGRDWPSLLGAPEENGDEDDRDAATVSTRGSARSRFANSGAATVFRSQRLTIEAQVVCGGARMPVKSKERQVAGG